MFQNFKADSYRKWIDGMRRLATEATDGSMVTVVVSRDGSPVTTKVRIPENQVGPIKLPLGPQPQNPQAGGNEVNTVVANGGDSNVSIGNSGNIASFFKDASQPGAERAVAELFRIGPSHKVSESGLDNGNVENNQRPSARPPQPGGARRLCWLSQ